MKQTTIVFFVVIVISSVFTIAVCIKDAELQLVQLVWRHGDRAPVQLYPTDPNTEDFWKEGLGKLTMLGRRQHYALGKLLRKIYKNFTTTDPVEIEAVSSDCDRCMKSALTNLASFYAPTQEWQFEKDVNWQPIFIKYIPKEEDKYLETDSYCPTADKEKLRIVNSKEGQKIIAENWEMFQYLRNHSGFPVTNWTYAAYLFDTLKIEKKYNLTIPSWANTYWDQLHNVSNMAFFWSFNSPLMLRLRAGPLLGKLIENMKKKISNEIPELKVQIYSTHDTTVAVLLEALNLFNMIQPPYCATVIFELYEKENEYFVRLLYLNSSTPELADQVPNILILDGCEELCPLENFINRTKHLIPDDWELECKLKSLFFDINKTSVTAGLIFTLLAVFIIGISSFAFWKLRSRNKVEYSYHLMQTDIN